MLFLYYHAANKRFLRETVTTTTAKKKQDSFRISNIESLRKSTIATTPKKQKDRETMLIMKSHQNILNRERALKCLNLSSAESNKNELSAEEEKEINTFFDAVLGCFYLVDDSIDQCFIGAKFSCGELKFKFVGVHEIMKIEGLGPL